MPSTPPALLLGNPGYQAIACQTWPPVYNEFSNFSSEMRGVRFWDTPGFGYSNQSCSAQRPGPQGTLIPPRPEGVSPDTEVPPSAWYLCIPLPGGGSPRPGLVPLQLSRVGSDTQLSSPSPLHTCACAHTHSRSSHPSSLPRRSSLGS